MQFKYLSRRLLLSLKRDSLYSTIKKVFNTLFTDTKIDLDEIMTKSPENLDDIFIKFGTDKGSLDGKKTYDYLYKNLKTNEFKNYLDWIKRKNPENYKYQLGLNSTPIYEKIFSSRRMQKLKILEIGVANGHSIASWHHYFPNSIIYGIDNKKAFKFFYKSSRVKYYTIDVFDEKKIKNFISENGKFDYIIDDSLNTKEAMFKNIKNFYPSLNSGGAYFLEDYGFYDHTQKALKEVKCYNLEHKMEYFLESRTMREILEMIRNKILFEDKILDHETLKYIFASLKNVEFAIYDHPYAAMAIIHKK